MENIHKTANWPWVTFGITICSILFLILTQYYSEGFARAESICIGMIIASTKPRWEMRRDHLWFWLTLFSIIFIQTITSIYIPWTSHWVPSFIIYPFAIADLIIILWLLQSIEKYMNHGVLPNMPEKIQNQNEEPGNI